MAPIVPVLSFLLLSVNGFAEFKDSRDSQVYGTKNLGSLTWMTENLRHRQEGMMCYNNEVQCADLGGLYTFNSALTACPDGWRLPSDADWKDLEIALSIPKAELNFNDYSKKRGLTVGRSLKLGGKSGLKFKISGYASLKDDEWTFEGITGDRPRSYFWTSTTEIVDGETLVYRRRIEKNNDSIFRFANPQEGFAVSVRCVRDNRRSN